MRFQQYLPGALLVLFAAALWGGIALVQMAKNRAEAEYLAETAAIDAKRVIVDRQFAIDPDPEQWAVRTKVLDEDQERADRKEYAALDVAKMWQMVVICAGFGMFIVFVGVMLYQARKSASAP